MIRLLLVDHRPLLRMGFRLILDGESDMEVVGEAGDGAAAVATVLALQPDVGFMDVPMPGVDGSRATAENSASGSASRALILTTFDVD